MSEEKKTRVFWIPENYHEDALEDRAVGVNYIKFISYGAFQDLQKENAELKALAQRIAIALEDQIKGYACYCDLKTECRSHTALSEYKQWKEKNETT